MRASATTALAALLLAGSALVTVGAASASASGTPTCVSTSEFRHVNDGMSRARVQQIFGTAGVQDFRNITKNGHVDTRRSYTSCVRGPAVTVSYTDARVTYKTAS